MNSKFLHYSRRRTLPSRIFSAVIEVYVPCPSEGIYGNHAKSRALTAKILRAHYLWPTMKENCLKFVKKCDKCKRFGELKHTSSEELHCLETSWSFHKWGIDILRPFPLAPGRFKYLVVAINYFTKWIKVEPLPTTMAEKVRKLVWKRIIFRYGVSHQLVSNNGTQFMDWRFKDLCRELGITQLFSSVKHPQTNGLAEATNKVIFVGLKKRLEQPKVYGLMNCTLCYKLIILRLIRQPRKHHIGWCTNQML